MEIYKNTVIKEAIAIADSVRVISFQGDDLSTSSTENIEYIKLFKSNNRITSTNW